MRAEAWVRFAATHVRVVEHHSDGTLNVQPLQILELAGRDEARLLAGGLLDAEDLHELGLQPEAGLASGTAEPAVQPRAAMAVQTSTARPNYFALLQEQKRKDGLL